jgi:hypothetical protein
MNRHGVLPSTAAWMSPEGTVDCGGDGRKPARAGCAGPTGDGGQGRSGVTRAGGGGAMKAEHRVVSGCTSQRTAVLRRQLTEKNKKTRQAGLWLRCRVLARHGQGLAPKTDKQSKHQDMRPNEQRQQQASASLSLLETQRTDRRPQRTRRVPRAASYTTCFVCVIWARSHYAVQAGWNSAPLASASECRGYRCDLCACADSTLRTRARSSRAKAGWHPRVTHVQLQHLGPRTLQALLVSNFHLLPLCRGEASISAHRNRSLPGG